jgi:UDP-N-acetylmuramate dehydrogenase
MWLFSFAQKTKPIFPMSFHQNFDLSTLNTFGIKSIAPFFAEFHSVDELGHLLNHIPKKPIMILGGGSNILLTQAFEGTILQNKISGIEIIEESEHDIIVRVGAGEVWHDVVMWAVNNNYGGIENLSLIPGSVGASPMQNIGAYGVEIKDVLTHVEAFHIQNREVHNFSNDACKFGYRESVFKRELKGAYVIVYVTFKLSKSPKLNLDYGAIREVLNERNISNPTIKDVSDAVIHIRQSKLPDPKVIGNAGSFFKNPAVKKEQYQALQVKYPNMPSYPLNETHVKVPAGWLIEQAGWKGKDFGNYGVHDKQALVLVNRGGASGQDIYDLSTKIVEDIEAKFGIELEREVNVV